MTVKASAKQNVFMAGLFLLSLQSHWWQMSPPILKDRFQCFPMALLLHLLEICVIRATSTPNVKMARAAYDHDHDPVSVIQPFASLWGNVETSVRWLQLRVTSTPITVRACQDCNADIFYTTDICACQESDFFSQIHILLTHEALSA
uniref:Putative secreted protein n=1 Tax=Ixodes ricinus TaxID=34613 RepID=A0A6B0UUM9_IXORI